MAPPHRPRSGPPRENHHDMAPPHRPRSGSTTENHGMVPHHRPRSRSFSRENRSRPSSRDPSLDQLGHRTRTPSSNQRMHDRNPTHPPQQAQPTDLGGVARLINDMRGFSERNGPNTTPDNTPQPALRPSLGNITPAELSNKTTSPI